MPLGPMEKGASPLWSRGPTFSGPPSQAVQSIPCPGPGQRAATTPAVTLKTSPVTGRRQHNNRTPGVTVVLPMHKAAGIASVM